MALEIGVRQWLNQYLGRRYRLFPTGSMFEVFGLLLHRRQVESLAGQLVVCHLRGSRSMRHQVRRDYIVGIVSSVWDATPAGVARRLTLEQAS